MDKDLIITFKQGGDEIGVVRITAKEEPDEYTMNLRSAHAQDLVDALSLLRDLLSEGEVTSIKPATIPVE